MKQKKENRYMIDALFVITLFCLFAVSAMVLIAVGAKVYKNTIDHMDTHFTSNTAMCYITEKVRQSDCSDSLTLCEFGDYQALKFSQNIHDEIYCTYIYSYCGYLKELFAKEDFEADPSAGQNILPVLEFHIVEQTDGLYKITLVDHNHKKSSIIIGTKCDE